MKIIYGDLIRMGVEGEVDVILHGCNCFNTMGAGFAKQIKETFPEAYEADLKTVRGDSGKGGWYSKAEIGDLTIYNLYTQYGYGKGAKRFNKYWLESAINKIYRELVGKVVGLPMIGCGLAGGNIGELMDALSPFHDLDLTIVRFS